MQSLASPTRLRVNGSERVGPYTLLRLERGGLDPARRDSSSCSRLPGRLLPRPFSLCLAPSGELAFLVDPIGPGTEALCERRVGDEIGVLGPLGHGYRLDVERPLLVGGGIGIAPLPYLAEQLGGSPPIVLGFRSEEHAEAAVLLPGAEVVDRSSARHGADRAGFDVLACGPEPMLHAVAALCPSAQLAWEAPMACGYGACYGCVVEIDGALKRLCLEGPVLDATRVQTGGGTGVRILNASGCLDALAAPEVARQLDAFVTKTVTPLPRAGKRAAADRRDRARGCSTRSASPTPAASGSSPSICRGCTSLASPLWVSVGGFCAADYAETCSHLTDIEAVELNLSCPNVDEAADSAAEIVAACRGATELPLYAKLSAAHPDVAEVARAVAAAGADGLSLINTLRALALDDRLRPTLARGSGGLRAQC